jgi:hypothetical protein
MNAHTSLTRLEQVEAIACYRRMTELMHRLPAEKLVDLIRAAVAAPGLAMTEPANEILDACDVFEAVWREEDLRFHGVEVGERLAVGMAS